jgi:hypothetical protein
MVLMQCPGDVDEELLWMQGRADKGKDCEEIIKWLYAVKGDRKYPL